jgi:hypothetical protein
MQQEMRLSPFKVVKDDLINKENPNDGQGVSGSRDIHEHSGPRHCRKGRLLVGPGSWPMPLDGGERTQSFLLAPSRAPSRPQPRV